MNLLQSGPRELRAFAQQALGSLLSRESLTVLGPLALLWEVLPRVGLIPDTLVPPPSRVALAAWELVQTKALLEHVGLSLLRFGMGLGLAILLALPLGLLMGWNVFIRKHSLPLFQLLAPIPPPAWVPMAIVLLGIGLPMQIFLIFLGAFYPILFNTYQGVKDTDPRYLASARVFGASEFTLLRQVYFWSALGSIVMGIKIGIALGLVMLVIAEMHGGHSGIGYLLIESKEYFQIDRMVVAMVLLGFLGWLLIEIMKFIEAKLALWKGSR